MYIFFSGYGLGLGIIDKQVDLRGLDDFNSDKYRLNIVLLVRNTTSCASIDC
jgi:hypothetical protein